MKHRYTVAILLFVGCLTSIHSFAAEDDSTFADGLRDLFGEREGGVAVPKRKSNEPTNPTTETPSDVRGPADIRLGVEELIAEIQLLRDEFGLYDYPPSAVPQADRQPIHMYFKSLVILTKVRRVQERFGVHPAPVGQLPPREIRWSDIADHVADLLTELRRLKKELVIDRELDPLPLVGDASPQLIYTSLSDASLLLDGLVGEPAGSADVCRSLTHAMTALSQLAVRLSVPVDRELPIVDTPKKPSDVAPLILRGIYKAISLQLRIGLDGSAPPSIKLVRITPTENLDLANVLLAEIARINVHMKVDGSPATPMESTGTTPAEALALAVGIARNLTRVAQGTDG